MVLHSKKEEAPSHPYPNSLTLSETDKGNTDMNLTAREALDRAIAAAEQADATHLSGGLGSISSAMTSAQRAQAWAAIAHEIAMQTAYEEWGEGGDSTLRARVRSAQQSSTHPYTREVLEAILDEGGDGGTCPYCGDEQAAGVHCLCGADEGGDGGDRQLLCRACEEGYSQASVLQDDLAQALRLLGLGDHARPKSPHQVFMDEVLPAIRKLVGDGGDQ